MCKYCAGLKVDYFDRLEMLFGLIAPLLLLAISESGAVDYSKFALWGEAISSPSSLLVRVAVSKKNKERKNKVRHTNSFSAHTNSFGAHRENHTHKE